MTWTEYCATILRERLVLTPQVKRQAAKDLAKDLPREILDALRLPSWWNETYNQK